MEQRLLRLGDIVDDYCPRERRVTNHAIVAIVEDAIRQTRCTTCDHEHPFKQGREPRRRKKDAPSLYDQVLADVAGAQLAPPRIAAPQPAPDSEPIDPAPAADAAGDDDRQPPAPDDAWPAHRTLIRASLPRVEGEPPPPRPIPEFTMHQKPPAPRGRGFRFQHGRGDAMGFGGGRDGRQPRGGHGARHGHGHGNGNGNGNVIGNGNRNVANGNSSGGGRRRGGKRGR